MIFFKINSQNPSFWNFWFYKGIYKKIDESKVGLGAVLCQDHLINEKQVRFPVAYTSRFLFSTEHNYEIIVLKGLTLIWTI